MQANRVLTWLVAAGVGAVYGTAATIAHAYTLGILPLGLVLAVVGTGALLVALRTLTGDRWTALAGGLGLLATMIVFTHVGPGGSAVIAPPTPETGWIPLAWTFLAPILVAVTVAWPDVSGVHPARKLDE
jgi:hypothetical protein